MIRKLCLVYPDQMPLPSCFARVASLPRRPVLLPPLGLLYAAGATRREVAVVDNRLEKLGVEALVDRLAGFDAVGFSGTLLEAPQAVAAAGLLRRLGIPTLYGGPNATVNWELYPGVFTAILRGEAEGVLEPLLDALAAGRRPDGFEERDGAWVNPRPARLADLDALPFPDRSLLPLAAYPRREEEYLPGLWPVDTVVSSRGCPFACGFCSSQVIWGRRVVFRSAENVAAEMAGLAGRLGTRGVYFREDNFTASRERLLRFCAAAEPLGLPWLCESRVDTLDEETLRRMAGAGCRAVWFGLESTSDETLRRIGKGFTLEQARRTIALCRRAGIRTGGSFILGFPHESRSDLERTVRESRTLGLDRVHLNRLYAIPRSPLHDEVRRRGLARHEHGHIILPDTEHLHADEVTRIFWRAASSWRRRLAGSVLPEGWVEGLDRAALALLTPLRALAGAGR